MSRRSKAPGAPKTTAWRWRRWIKAGGEETWIARLSVMGGANWALTRQPDRVRLLLEFYPNGRAGALRLKKQFGGRVQVIRTRDWLQTAPTPPTRIGRELEIIHDGARSRKRNDPPQLRIPHGLAFGSGEHATTYLLLRALAGRAGAWSDMSVLDLGTGSGVLALAARLLGARKILASDFDPAAVRTARQNEARNFSKPLIRWRCEDVTRLRVVARHDLVLANLFSGILIAAARQIARSVSPGGELWISGVQQSQQEEVIAAYLTEGLNFVREVHRGKWVMLIFTAATTKPDAGGQETTGGAMKTTQTK